MLWKVAIVSICIVATLCGSSNGSVLRQDNLRSRAPQLGQQVNAEVRDDYDNSDNEIEQSFEATEVQQEVATSTTSRTIDPEQVLAEIQKSVPSTLRPNPSTSADPSKSSENNPTDPEFETTTEYKYKDLVQPYIIPQPSYIPMRHASGTHYIKVNRGQDQYVRIMEDYRRLFGHDSRPAQHDYATPPSY